MVDSPQGVDGLEAREHAQQAHDVLVRLDADDVRTVIGCMTMLGGAYDREAKVEQPPDARVSSESLQRMRERLLRIRDSLMEQMDRRASLAYQDEDAVFLWTIEMLGRARSFEMGHGVKLIAREQPGGGLLWIVSDEYEWNVLTKSGRWVRLRQGSRLTPSHRRRTRHSLEIAEQIAKTEVAKRKRRSAREAARERARR